MDESESKKHKPNEGQRRLDPELLKKGLRCDLDQYEMLKRCHEKRDMTEWNKWRHSHPKTDIFLDGANLSSLYLKDARFDTGPFTDFSGQVYLNGADFRDTRLDKTRFHNAHLKGANLWGAYLIGADMFHTHLECANLEDSYLEGTYFEFASLENARFRAAVVDGFTLFWKCKVDHNTDFSEVALNNTRMDSEIKQLLEYNIRRKNWEQWYEKGYWWERVLKRLFIWPFWWISDYGLRTWRIIFTFFGLAIGFAVIYRLWANCIMVNQVAGDIRGLWHALYFSVVTMTTLGFGDIAANPDSWAGQTLLMVQVILGYVLLGALVTRFAVLFTAGGPAGRFADEQNKKDKRQEKAE
jgi:hypothetical protein